MKKHKNISTGIFWYWNLTPTREGITEQLTYIAEAGFSCVYIHPMPDDFHRHVFFEGMQCEYLGKEYFELMHYTLRECKRLGLYMMLYDEGGWPSGSVLDTLVEKYPECRAKVFVRKEDGSIVEEFEPYPDQFRAEPVKRFIEMTHELYKKEFGEEFGRTIRGIFTDEPFLKLLVAYQKIVVNDEIIAMLKENYGLDFLKDVMPCIGMGRTENQAGEGVRRAYYDVCTKLFAKHYSEQLAAWCEENNLELEGHFSGEDQYIPFGATGNLLRVLTPLHVPGVDSIWRQIYPGAQYSYFPRFASSAAIRAKRTTALCEAFNVYTYGLTPKVVNFVANALLIQGINRILPMPYLYTDAGKRKICCSTDISHRVPIFDAFKEFNRVWNFVGNFNAGALQPRVWVMPGVMYPGCEDGVERRKNQDACEEYMCSIADTLDLNGVFWRFADEDDADADEIPELLIIPFPEAMLPAQKTAVDAWKLKGVKVVNALDDIDLKKYAEFDIQGENSCRILPCQRAEGKAVMVFNSQDKWCDFKFRTEKNFALASHENYDEVYPLTKDGNMYTLPMAPCSLRVLSEGAETAEAKTFEETAVELKWKATSLEQLRMTLEEESCFELKNVSVELPESGNYCEIDKDFSGRITLESSVSSDKDETVYIRFENIDHSAKLFVNGIDCGSAVCSPFIFKAELKKGENSLVLKVSGSAGNEFRRCFAEELEPAGYFNVYAARFKKYSVDDDKCGISKQIFIYKEK